MLIYKFWQESKSAYRYLTRIGEYVSYFKPVTDFDDHIDEDTTVKSVR